MRRSWPRPASRPGLRGTGSWRSWPVRGDRGRPRGWPFGIRATRLWPTVGWATLGFALMLGFELGYIWLLAVDETSVEDVAGADALAAVLVALAVIVVAPVTEEFFFRAFFYRALRTRLRVWSATAIILPVIADFGVASALSSSERARCSP